MGRLHNAELDVTELPEPCRACTFWEAAGKPGAELTGEERAQGMVAKESWWQATTLEWGPCATAIWDGGKLLGYALVAPGPYLQRTEELGRVTEDALLLAVLWIAEDADALGVSAQLVEGALLLAAARGAQALEAFGSPGAGPSCVPSAELLEHCGFALLRPGYPYRRYRLDLRQTARWKEGVEQALVGVRRMLRPGKLGRVPSMPSVLAGRRDQGGGVLT